MLKSVLDSIADRKLSRALVALGFTLILIGVAGSGLVEFSLDVGDGAPTTTIAETITTG